MNKLKAIATCLLASFLALSATAQLSNRSYEASFGDPTEIKGKEKIKTTSIIAETEDKLFIVLSDNVADFRDNYGKLRIQSIDKKTLNPIKTIDVWEDLHDGTSQKLNDILVTSNGLLVVSEGYSDGEAHMYVGQLDYDLFVMGFAQKVNNFDRNTEKCRVIQRDGNNEFVVLTQKSAKGGENMFVDYKLYDENIRLVKEGTLDIGMSPEVKTGIFTRNRTYNIINEFEFSTRGDMVYVTWIYDEKAQQGSYNLIFANPYDGNVEIVPMMNNDEGYVGEYTMLLMGNEIVLTGLYGTEANAWGLFRSSKSAPSVGSFNGNFLQRYNAETKKLTRTILTPFSQDIMNQLTMTNPALKIGVLFRKKSREREQENVSGTYDIQKVVYSPEQEKATFYLEYVYNTVSTTTSTGANGAITTTTTYTSKRGNVFYYEISLKDGSINWYNTIRKYAFYSSGNSTVWYLKSLFIVARVEGDMLLYNSQRIFNENDPNDLTGIKIKTKKLDQNYFIASINGRDGSYITELPRMTSDKLKPYEKIQMNRSFISDKDRACYTINSQYKYRPELVTLWCATLPFCFAGYFLYAFGRKNAFNETYTLGRMTF